MIGTLGRCYDFSWLSVGHLAQKAKQRNGLVPLLQFEVSHAVRGPAPRHRGTCHTRLSLPSLSHLDHRFLLLVICSVGHSATSNLANASLETHVHDASILDQWVILFIHFFHTLIDLNTRRSSMSCGVRVTIDEPRQTVYLFPLWLEWRLAAAYIHAVESGARRSELVEHDKRDRKWWGSRLYPFVILTALIFVVMHMLCSISKQVP